MTLVTILLIVLLFGVSVFVHELGHFLVARALGLKATVFSIGMGPAIWKRQVGGTRVQIGCLPIGGFVALPQMDPASCLEGEAGDAGGEGEEDGDRLLPAPPWKRLLVALAGAAGNMVFAVVLGTVVWLAGRPASLQEHTTLVGWVAEGSAAEAAGLRAGHYIAAVNGTPVENWNDILTEVALSPGDTVTLTLDGLEPWTIEVPLEEGDDGGRWLQDIDGPTLCQVADVSPGSPADEAGLKPGDVLLRYGGLDLHSRAQLVQLVGKDAGAEAELVWTRDGKHHAATLAARYDETYERWLLGVSFNLLGDLDYENPSHPTPWEQVSDHSGSIFRFLKALVTPSTARATGRSVGGPVSIFFMLFLMVKTSFMLAVWFTGFLNVNLAIINLLPLPVLDGGHIVFALWEIVFRKPLPAGFVRRATTLFAVLFIALFLYLTFRDTKRQVIPAIKAAATENAEKPESSDYSDSSDCSESSEPPAD